MTHRTITKGRFCLTFIRNSAAKQLGIGFGFRRGIWGDWRTRYVFLTGRKLGFIGW
jgi:hypothetical protein